MDVEAETDFREYVTSRYRSLLGTAYLLCGNHGHAEDLVQNTLAKAYLAWDRIRRESADRYVRRVLLNDHLSQRRRLWWREVPTEHIDMVGDADIHRVHERDVLFRALRTLPARQRAAVVLLLGPALAARGVPPDTTPDSVPGASSSWPPGCGSPATGMTTIDGTPWPANQDHLGSIAQDIDAHANAHFGGSYNGDEILLETDQVRVYRVPNRDLDKWLRTTYGPSCVVLVDATHPKAQLQALADRIEADASYWQSRGIRINEVGILPQGTVQIGTLDVAKAQQQFPGRYGHDAPIVFTEQARIAFDIG